MRFLERYLRGKHEQVWADLRGLVPEVRDDAHLADARSVAEETMRRVRNNVEVLRTRLEKAGYRFKEPDRAHVPPAPDIAVQLDKFERQQDSRCPFTTSTRWSAPSTSPNPGSSSSTGTTVTINLP
ncbi:hypothetical protein AB0H57_21525 [Micromonospora sp. NPDC050686]|uniref:hypothetical protein n=1 Tax=Micromonospora sp. NPDC050686 TaxID=3154631 RepID=UPI003406BC81